MNNEHIDTKISSASKVVGSAFELPPPTVNTVADLYRKYLASAQGFRSMADDHSRSEQIRSHFHDRAFALESKASSLAHCLAWFGNSNLYTLDIEALRAEVSEMVCQDRNPWMRGLRIIEVELKNSKSN